ncbi:MAG: Hsp20/alpha crystallin family protein, partial [Caulobacteraceae bacterium]
LGELWGQAGAESFSGLRPARPFAAWSMAPLLGLPPADVKETQDAYKLCIELPGLTRADIDLQMRGDMLVVSGQKAEDRDDASAAYRVSERRFGRFERRFPIPPEVKREGIDAAFRDGVLTITLPKSAEAAREQNRIEIKGA